MLRLLLFVLPLGLDTLGVSISLGIKSRSMVGAGLAPALADPTKPRPHTFPPWLASALLFSLAETIMPVVGLTIGYAVSLLISNIMHILGPLLLIGVGLWELQDEIRERINKRKKHQSVATDNQNVVAPLAGTLSGGQVTLSAPTMSTPASSISAKPSPWTRQLLLALSVSLDELAIGFSLGAITSSLPGNKTFSTVTLCILIGLQGFLMTLIGLALGRTLRSRLIFAKDWTEFLSCFLLIALGIWLFVT